MTHYRLRWWNPQVDDAAIVPWVYPSLVIATLFLNAAFFYEEGSQLPPGASGGPLHDPTLWNFVLVFGEAILLAALFYLGPTLAAQASKRSLFGLAEASLGSIGAFGLRACCAVFLVLWLGEQVNWIVRLSVPFWGASLAGATVESIAAGTLVLLLFWTGLQDLRVAAKLAFFSNKLAVALLIAALIRVKEGWPAALHTVTSQGWMPETGDLWRGLAQLSFWAAPLLFLAASFGQRCQSGKQVRWIGLFGIVLPVAAVLLVLGFIERAAHSAGASTQGIANIGSALFHGDSMRYYLDFLAVLAISMFGAARYGIRALADCLNVFRHYRFVYWTMLGLAGCAISVLAWAARFDLSNVIMLPARCLVASAAVLSADFLTRQWRVASVRRMDWIGVAALSVGCGIPYLPNPFFDADSTLHDPWLLRTYVASFLVCFLGRMAPRCLRHFGRPAQAAPYSI